MKFDTGVQKAILRLKAPDNQRVTGNLREAVELVSVYMGSLALGVQEELRGGYRAQILHTELGPRAFLVKGSGTNRVAFIAQPRVLWDAEGAVQAANTEYIRIFVKEVSQGLLEAIGEQLGRIRAEQLREIAKLLGKNGGSESVLLRRQTDWSGAENHA